MPDTAMTLPFVMPGKSLAICPKNVYKFGTTCQHPLSLRSAFASSVFFAQSLISLIRASGVSATECSCQGDASAGENRPSPEIPGTALGITMNPFDTRIIFNEFLLLILISCWGCYIRSEGLSRSLHHDRGALIGPLGDGKSSLRRVRKFLRQQLGLGTKRIDLGRRLQLRLRVDILAKFTFKPYLDFSLPYAVGLLGDQLRRAVEFLAGRETFQHLLLDRLLEEPDRF